MVCFNRQCFLQSVDFLCEVGETEILVRVADIFQQVGLIDDVDEFLWQVGRAVVQIFCEIRILHSRDITMTGYEVQDGLCFQGILRCLRQMTVGLTQGLFLVRNELDMHVLLILFSLLQDTLQICRVISDDPGSRVVDGYDVVHTDSPFAEVSCIIYRRGKSALSSAAVRGVFVSENLFIRFSP